MLQNSCKILGFKKNMVNKIPPASGLTNVPTVIVLEKKVKEEFTLQASSTDGRIRPITLVFENICYC